MTYNRVALDGDCLSVLWRDEHPEEVVAKLSVGVGGHTPAMGNTTYKGDREEHQVQIKQRAHSAALSKF